MNDFRRLMTVVMIAGAAAGLLLSAIQFVTIRPMIETAEVYETQLIESGKIAHEVHDDWEPSEGAQRVGLTVLGTVLLSIGYAAMLFSGATLVSVNLNLRSGLLLGALGFVSFALAPAVGLPPKPPGVEGAQLNAGQLWWTMTAALTALGFSAIALARGRWTWRLIGAACIAVPHMIGPPPMPTPLTPELQALSVKFAAISVASQLPFWLALGAIGGILMARNQSDDAGSFVSATAR